MPSGTNERPSQQIVNSGAGFPGSSFYPSHNIWASRGLSTNLNNPTSVGISGLTNVPDSDGSPTGFGNALMPNSEADPVWSSRPWNNNDHSPRGVSTSPGTTRAGLTGGAALFDPAPPAIGRPNGGYDAANEANGYAALFGSRQRPQESYMDSIAARSGSRDSSLTSSRQQQGSTLPDRYRQGHTPSNSIHSQRAGPNSRSFGLNSQVESDLALRFRHASIDDPNGGAAQPFQLNPGSQPWNSNDESTSWRLGPSSDPYDSVGSYFGNIGLAGRQEMGSNYRLENGNSLRGYATTPESFSSRRPSRDQRSTGVDPRDLLQQQQQQQLAMRQNFIGTTFDYTSFPAQYPVPGLGGFNPGFQQPLMQGYGLPGTLPNFLAGASSLAPSPRRDQDPARGIRSALLEEFRHSNKSSRRHDLKDIYNHVVEFSGDQHGSRFIQQKLETANSDEKDQVFREIEPNATQLMKDVFGNYVVQKFFEHGNQVQKKVLAEKMKGKVIDLSVQVYACRVVQKALEHVLVEQQAELTKELEADTIRVIKDQNGNHVVQKVIELVPRQYLDFIMNNLRGQVQTLATHTYGCRVIQRVLEHGTEEDKAEVMKELHSSIHMLITDQFGNYVAQHVIVNGKPEDSQRFIKLVLDNFVAFSKHKFASNVVEKCIECATPEQRTQVRELLNTATSDGTTNLQHMIRDQFGNYVVQKLVVGLSGEERDSFVDEIKPQFFQLKKTNGNSKQLQAMEKLLDVNGSGSGSSPGSPATREKPAGSGDGSSTSPTPNLTNNTNSPQSSSPSSAHASTVHVAVNAGKKPQSANNVNAIALVEDSEV